MSKSTAKTLAIVGGVCTIIGAATAAEKSRGWKDIHKTAATVGLIVALVAMFS